MLTEVRHKAVRWVMCEYGNDASDRTPLMALWMTGPEAGEMNRRLLLTPCRVWPEDHFPHFISADEVGPTKTSGANG